MNETNPYDNVNDTANEAAQGEAPTITSVMSEAAQNTNSASDNVASGIAQGADMPSEPNFTLINPDDPTLNPEAWAETKGGTEGIYTGEKKDEKKSWKSWVPGKRDQDVMDPNFTDPTWPEDFEPEEDDEEDENGDTTEENGTASGTALPAVASATAWNGGNGGHNGNGGNGGFGGNSWHSSHMNGDGSAYVTKKFLAIALAITVVISSAIGAGMGVLLTKKTSSYSNLSSSSQEVSTGSSMTVQQIYKKNADAVVEITTEVTSSSVLGSSTSEGAGSGVIVQKNGYIATNYHVIEGASKISVRLRNEKTYRATVVGYDESNDVAVLKINAKNLTTVTIGKSAEVQVGDLAVAIGNPLGTLGGTTTSGIISALDRKLEINNKRLTLLQTDSAINPGNSGGGLFNDKGELIGLVVAKGSGTDIEGLGFAIPIDTAAPIIDDIIDNGTITEKPAAGMSIFTATEENMSQYNVDQTGVYIYEVYGTNAIKAGLKAGDRITKFNGKAVTDSDKLIAAIQKKKVGDEISLTVERNGKEITVKFKLEKASQFENRQSSNSSSGGSSGN
jgi:serine protease Do